MDIFYPFNWLCQKIKEFIDDIVESIPDSDEEPPHELMWEAMNDL